MENVADFFRLMKISGNLETYEINDLAAAFNPITLADQVNFIGSVSNYHYSELCHHASQRFLSIPLEKDRVPLSPRNKLIYYHRNSNMAAFESQIDALQSGASFTRKRKLKYKPRRARPAEQEDAAPIPEELIAVHSMAQPGAETRFEQFTHSILQYGKFLWRSHSSESDTFLMNDYDINLETMKPSSFEHVQVDYYSDGAIFNCSCSAFDTMKSQSLVDDAITANCVHCDFIKEYVFPNYDDIISGSCDEGRILQFLQSAFDEDGPNLVRISDEGSKTVKYSVKAGVEYENPINFVHITTDKDMIHCQSGMCAVAMRQTARHRSRSLISLDNFENLCPHLQMMKRHADQWLGCIAEETFEVCQFPSDMI